MLRWFGLQTQSDVPQKKNASNIEITLRTHYLNKYFSPDNEFQEWSFFSEIITFIFLKVNGKKWARKKEEKKNARRKSENSPLELNSSSKSSSEKSSSEKRESVEAGDKRCEVEDGCWANEVFALEMFCCS